MPKRKYKRMQEAKLRRQGKVVCHDKVKQDDKVKHDKDVRILGDEKCYLKGENPPEDVGGEIAMNRKSEDGGAGDAR